MITVQNLIDKVWFDVVYSSPASLAREITTADIMRPGLEMSGYMDYYTPERIQLFGMKEWSYMMRVDGEDRFDNLVRIFDKLTPAVIVARGLTIPSEMLAAARNKDVTLLQSNEPTSRLSGKIAAYLDNALAVRESIHGVLMDIYGVGVLIQGSSGIGKSETGLELVRRGHRLVADDRVDVYKADEFTVIGEPPEILRNMLEIRGVGIIDAMTLFGTGAVKENSQIDLVISLENPENDVKEFDRLGEKKYTVKLADVEVPQLQIPVKIGRNVSIIVESAVMNFRAKAVGLDATKVFEDRLTALIEKNEAGE